MTKQLLDGSDIVAVLKQMRPHGRTIPGATVLDGYGARTIELEKGVRPFDSLFGEGRGRAWGLKVVRRSAA